MGNLFVNKLKNKDNVFIINGIWKSSASVGQEACDAEMFLKLHFVIFNLCIIQMQSRVLIINYDTVHIMYIHVQQCTHFC